MPVPGLWHCGIGISNLILFKTKRGIYRPAIRARGRLSLAATDGIFDNIGTGIFDIANADSRIDLEFKYKVIKEIYEELFDGKEVELLSDLQDRLARTRIPAYPAARHWSAGTDPAYLSDLLHFWRHSFDWRKQEALLNEIPHFKTEIDGIEIHYVDQRGTGANPFPLLLTHGYPDSFYRFVDLIPMLTDPESYGGSAEDSFDVIVPDLPGYGFSGLPSRNGTIFRVGSIWNQLMTGRLGYRHYGAHGGDWGSTVTEELARDYSDNVVAIHMTDVPFGHAFQRPHDLTSVENRFFQENDEWMKKEGAYALIQSTKPHSLAPALNNSPVGLAAWMLEKFHGWSDCNGDIESRFTKVQLLTHIIIYWATGSIGTSFLPYYDYANASTVTWIEQGIKKLTGSSKVPAGFAIFPKDISQPPREWGSGFSMSSGGKECHEEVISLRWRSRACWPTSFATGSAHFDRRSRRKLEQNRCPSFILVDRLVFPICFLIIPCC